jgi:DNA-directed RNA polymerase specialized sigma24 family protein
MKGAVMAMSVPDLHLYDLSSESTWRELYPSLRALAKHFVYAFHVPCWHGQEEEMVEDIIQETARRIIERFRRTEQGELAPVHSLEHMIWAIACHYCVDMNRRDRRLVRMPSNDCPLDKYTAIDDEADLTEKATENASREELFILLAHEIAEFPAKQRRALLIDLANLMCFDEEPTPLQAAFLAVGIDLREYQLPLPDNPVERSQHSSLLYHAYKRVAQLLCVEEDISAA